MVLLFWVKVGFSHHFSKEIVIIIELHAPSQFSCSSASNKVLTNPVIEDKLGQLTVSLINASELLKVQLSHTVIVFVECSRFNWNKHLKC